MSGYKSVPFWSWNDDLNEEELRKQIRWMHDKGLGGFFMHARSGLITEYLSKKWMQCIEACADEAEKLGMDAWAYDENGWPSGFCGGKLLEDEENRDMYITQVKGKYDSSAYVSYKIKGSKLIRVNEESSGTFINLYLNKSVSTADILNEKVVKKFINSTHERYKNEVKGKVMGFFTDEPQYYRWDTPYTQVLPEYFKNKYNEDLFDNLGLLFYEYDGYKSFRYKYFKCMQELMISSFGKQIYDWCENNGYQLTGHYIDENSLQGQMLCCGGVMPFYEYQHIPGIDHLGRSTNVSFIAKQLDSVATQLGKKGRLAEIYALTGWNESPLELKALTDALYANGVNLTCQHLLPYSERGNRKRDYPEHFSNVNPWVSKKFEEYNEYFNKLSDFLTDNETFTNVAVFHPIRSAYFDYKRTDCVNSVAWLDCELKRVNSKLIDNQIQFHYIDETILAKHGSVKNNKLVVGKCEYEYLIFPSIYTMDKESYDIISKFVNNGGKILFEGIKPTYLEDKKFKYNFKSNVTFNQIKNAQPYTCSPLKGVTSRLVKDKNNDFKLFICNANSFDVYVNLNKKGAKSLQTFDIATGVTKYEPLDLKLNAYQSKIVTFTSKNCKTEKFIKPLILNGAYNIVSFEENYLTLDTVEYSYNGVEYNSKLNVRKLFNKLLKDRYQGDLYVKYTFNCEYLPSEIYFTAEHNEIYFNGKLLSNPIESRFGRGFYKYNIANYVKKGVNEAILKYNYYQNDNVYYALFGENVTESLRNCMVYDTDIESAYVSGQFSVFGDFYTGSVQTKLNGNNFKIVKPNLKNITSLIKQGYPFLSGDITISESVVLQDTNYKLVFNYPFNLLNVKVNGVDAGSLLISNELDVSNYLKKGVNNFELTLSIGNRNTLGPFHNILEDTISVVTPNSWSDCYREDYSFEKSIFEVGNNYLKQTN